MEPKPYTTIVLIGTTDRKYGLPQKYAVPVLAVNPFCFKPTLSVNGFVAAFPGGAQISLFLQFHG